MVDFPVRNDLDDGQRLREWAEEWVKLPATMPAVAHWALKYLRKDHHFKNAINYADAQGIGAAYNAAVYGWVHGAKEIIERNKKNANNWYDIAVGGMRGGHPNNEGGENLFILVATHTFPNLNEDGRFKVLNDWLDELENGKDGEFRARDSLLRAGNPVAMACKQLGMRIRSKVAGDMARENLRDIFIRLVAPIAEADIEDLERRGGVAPQMENDWDPTWDRDAMLAYDLIYRWVARVDGNEHGPFLATVEDLADYLGQRAGREINVVDVFVRLVMYSAHPHLMAEMEIRRPLEDPRARDFLREWLQVEENDHERLEVMINVIIAGAYPNRQTWQEYADELNTVDALKRHWERFVKRHPAVLRCLTGGHRGPEKFEEIEREFAHEWTTLEIIAGDARALLHRFGVAGCARLRYWRLLFPKMNAQEMTNHLRWEGFEGVIDPTAPPDDGTFPSGEDVSALVFILDGYQDYLEQVEEA